jgi:prophage DNA circulation protein
VQVQVRSKVPGADSEGLPDVLVDLATDITTAAELIRLAVEEQIRLFRGDAARSRCALDRQYLSTEDIREQAATGVVRMPTGVPAARDVVAEVARVHRAFERNVFVVFAGGRQLGRLDEEIALRLGEPVVFLRLTPLAGG